MTLHPNHNRIRTLCAAVAVVFVGSLFALVSDAQAVILNCGGGDYTVPSRCSNNGQCQASGGGSVFVCGVRGQCTCNNPSPPAPPTLNISANPYPTITWAIATQNGTTEPVWNTSVTWNTTNTSSCYAINGDGRWAPSCDGRNCVLNGTYVSDELLTQTEFGLVCTGPGGNITGSVTVGVDRTAPPLTHLECVGATCSSVPGAGTSDCGPVSSSCGGAATPLTEQYVSRTTLRNASTGLPPYAFGNNYYYVSLKAWDTNQAESAWSTSSNFITPTGPYPHPDLSVDPHPPIAGAPATFTDNTSYGSSSVVSRKWDFGDGTVTTSGPAGQSSETHTYSAVTNSTTVKLLVQSSYMPTTDYCSDAIQFTLRKPVPTYREVRPGI